jgi:serine/threonine protein kinase
MTAKTFGDGDTLGGYRILGKIADGGMASVYRASDPNTGEIVAIKVVPPADGPKTLQRFEQEIVATLGLSHPHLVRGISYGADSETAFLVMEYVEGESLGDRIERLKILPEDEAVEIITQVAAALDYVHRLGIIHRDVKPDNILLSTDGVAKLSDLGLMKDTMYDLNLTRARSGLGTPNFMAPEQYQEARTAGVRCDVYSLGATLYMAVTGVLPFAARTDVVMLKKKLTNAITPPRELVPGLRPEVDLAIRRALRGDPEQRFASVSEFIEALTGSPLPEPARVASSGVASSGIERRASVRYESKVAGWCAAVGGRYDKGWKAYVKDISITGIGLLVNRRFEPNATLFIEVEAAEGEPGPTFMVRVVRAQEVGGGQWLVGGMFGRQIDEDDVKSLL